MNKILKFAFCAAVLLLLSGLAILTVFFPQTPSGAYDIWENRTLEKTPVLQQSTVFDGSYFKAVESYLSDHLYGRSSLLRCNTRYQRLRGSISINDVIVGTQALVTDNGIYNRFAPQTETASEQMAQRLATVRDVTEQNGGIFVFVGIPTQREVFRQEYPSYLNNGSERLAATMKYFPAALEQQGISSLFLLDTVSGSGTELTELYSPIDHHFTLKGAYLCCNAVLDYLAELGCTVEKVEENEISFEALPNPMLGTYNRKLYGCSPVTDRLWVYHSEKAVPYERWDNGNESDVPLIVLPNTDTAYVTYSAYMEGDKAETVVQTNRPELKKLLVVGDSFTNAMETILYMSFDEMRSLDYRHYTKMSLTDYIADYQPDVVLYIRDSSVYSSLEGNGNIQ